MACRLRVLDMHYTYLEGGDVGDVTCTVRTLRRVSLHLPGSSLLWSGLGGKALNTLAAVPCSTLVCSAPASLYSVAGSLDTVALSSLPWLP